MSVKQEQKPSVPLPGKHGGREQFTLFHPLSLETVENTHWHFDKHTPMLTRVDSPLWAKMHTWCAQLRDLYFVTATSGVCPCLISSRWHKTSNVTLFQSNTWSWPIRNALPMSRVAQTVAFLGEMSKRPSMNWLLIFFRNIRNSTTCCYDILHDIYTKSCVPCSWWQAMWLVKPHSLLYISVMVKTRKEYQFINSSFDGWPVALRQLCLIAVTWWSMLEPFLVHMTWTRTKVSPPDANLPDQFLWVDRLTYFTCVVWGQGLTLGISQAISQSHGFVWSLCWRINFQACVVSDWIHHLDIHPWTGSLSASRVVHMELAVPQQNAWSTCASQSGKSSARWSLLLFFYPILVMRNELCGPAVTRWMLTHKRM